jgi:hypothetical protein
MPRTPQGPRERSAEAERRRTRLGAWVAVAFAALATLLFALRWDEISEALTEFPAWSAAAAVGAHLVGSGAAAKRGVCRSTPSSRWRCRAMGARDQPNRRWAIELMRRRPGLLGRVISAGASTTDRTLLAEQEARETAARSFLAATARGAAPMIEDYLVCRAEWGFGPKDVNGRVHLWHGTDDRLIPVRTWSPSPATLPNCLASFTPTTATFSSARASARSSRRCRRRKSGIALVSGELAA